MCSCVAVAEEAEVTGMKLCKFTPKTTKNTIVKTRSVVKNFAKFDTAMTEEALILDKQELVDEQLEEN